MTRDRFGALVGVREDEGLLEPCVATLRRIGFHHIVLFCVEDFADRAAELEARYADACDVSVVPFRSAFEDASFLDLAGPFIGPVIERQRPDWLLMLDVDELPVARGGHLSGLRRLDEADSVTVQRYNFARRRGEGETDILARLDAPERIPLIADRRDTTPDLTATPGPRWSFHTIAPRVLIRPELFQRLGIGAHGASGWQGTGAGPRHIASPDMCIVHLPFTSYQRFEQKLRNVEAHLARSKFMTGQRAWHWKWWLRRYGEGALAEEYEREALSDGEYAQMRASGGVRTAQELLALGGSAASRDTRAPG